MLCLYTSQIYEFVVFLWRRRNVAENVLYQGALTDDRDVELRAAALRYFLDDLKLIDKQIDFQQDRAPTHDVPITRKHNVPITRVITKHNISLM